jgi:adenylate cyclase
MNTAPSTRPPPDFAQSLVQPRALYERPPAERPQHDTVAGIAEWLVGPGRAIESGVRAFDEFAWRVVAAGIPLLRVSIHSPTLHPQFLGSTFGWWRTTGQTTLVQVLHEVRESSAFLANPFRRAIELGETLRRRLDDAATELDFPVLLELREKGATDYYAMPIDSVHGTRSAVSFATDAAGGFTAMNIADLTLLARRAAVILDMHSQRWIARNLLDAYLGPKTGPRVLAGQIRRGMGEEMTAVLWSSDLRGFTERSDRCSGEQTIAMLNALFDAQAKPIHDHGGEILKFIGDGLLAIFPIEDAGLAGYAARNALEAAAEAQAAVAALSGAPVLAGEPPLRIVVALHVGLVTYGNIGAAQRLDFTVIGPAVNLVSRVEAVAKQLDRPIVVSDDFAAAYGRPMASLGRHALRGLANPRELFEPVP